MSQLNFLFCSRHIVGWLHHWLVASLVGHTVASLVGHMFAGWNRYGLIGWLDSWFKMMEKKAERTKLPGRKDVRKTKHQINSRKNNPFQLNTTPPYTTRYSESIYLYDLSIIISTQESHT